MILLFTHPNDLKIISGRKTITARYWIKAPPRVGDIVDAQTGYAKSTRFAKLKVTKVEQWTGSAGDPLLTADLAHKEGYNSLTEFIDAYHAFNASKRDIDSRRKHYFIHFQLHAVIPDR